MVPSTGRLTVPDAVKKLCCSSDGCPKKAPLLGTHGDVFGTRVCQTHYRYIKQKSEHWLSGGPCVRWYRPRGWQSQVTLFTGRESTSTCRFCRERIGELVKKGLPVPSVDKDTRNYMGCALCSIPEWSPTNGGTKRIFKEFGEERRCCEYSKSGGCRKPSMPST